MSENPLRESLRSSKRERKRKRRDSDFYSEDSAVEVDIDSAGSDTEFRCGSAKKKRLRRSSGSWWTTKRQAFGGPRGASGAAGVDPADWPTRDGCGERMLLRQWLQRQADDKTIPGLSWLDEDKTQIRIPWKHGSRTGWTIEDCRVYRAWAMHTGKIACVKEPKKWKANFRCALNSLPDVREMTNLSQKKGCDPYKVYQMLKEVPRKSLAKRTKQCILETIEDGPEESCPLSSFPKIQFPHSDIGINIKDEVMNLEIKLPIKDSFWQRDLNLKIEQPQLEAKRTHSLIPTVVEELAEESGGIKNPVLMSLQSTGPVILDSTKYQPVSPAYSSSSSSSPPSCNSFSEESICFNGMYLQDISNGTYLEDISLFPELNDIKLEPYFICEEIGYSENVQFPIGELSEV